VVHRIRAESASGLLLTDRRGRLSRPLVMDTGVHGRPRASAAGTHVFYGHESEGEEPVWQVRVVDVATMKAAVLMETAKVPLRDPSPHPDGERLVVASEEGSPGRPHLWEYLPAEGERRPLTTAEARADDQPAVSPAGRFVAFRGRVGDHPGDLFLLDLETLETRQLTQAPEASGQPCFLDEYRLVFTRHLEGGDSGLLLLDTLQCRERWLTGVRQGSADPARGRVRKGRFEVYYSSRRRGGRDVHRARVAGLRGEPA